MAVQMTELLSKVDKKSTYKIPSTKFDASKLYLMSSVG